MTGPLSQDGREYALVLLRRLMAAGAVATAMFRLALASGTGSPGRPLDRLAIGHARAATRAAMHQQSFPAYLKAVRAVAAPASGATGGGSTQAGAGLAYLARFHHQLGHQRLAQELTLQATTVNRLERA